MRRRLVAVGVAVTTVAGILPVAAAANAAHAVRITGRVPLSASPADPTEPVTDQALLDSIAAATAALAPRSERIAAVPVEALTADTAVVASVVRSLGGAVTGTVAGQIVQASMPVARIGDLALVDSVAYVQAPRLVTRPPSRASRAEVGPGAGPTVGQNVGLTNAAAWQAAGIAGSVKVGIIDYFDRGLWDASEEGPLPDSAHMFCLDSSTQAMAIDNLCSITHSDGKNTEDGFEHGVAVAQVVKDMAPGAELYLATAGTASDLQAAIDFFVKSGVHIVTRSLGAAYDGPGDGTGPLGTIVDYAAAHGINWFNSGGNDAADGYVRIVVAGNLASTGGYVDFDNGPGTDTYLRVSCACVLFDGIRWSDWDKAPVDRTDYAIEAWTPINDPGPDENVNPTALKSLAYMDDDQSAGAPPLEVADRRVCPGNSFGSDGGITYIRVKRKDGTSVAGGPDIIEVALGEGYAELGRTQAAYSAAKPVVDSANPSLIAVGAVDPADGGGSPDAIASYSSQGPTNDGRVKPDVAAPSCLKSTIYSPCFNGTSAASPTAAGLAALLLDAGVAQPGSPLAAAVRHFVIDRPFTAGGAADGTDNKYGAGQVRLPSVPTVAAATAASAYHALVPTRILDTRPATAIGSPIGVQPRQGIVDVVVTGVASVPAWATAVAINLTATDTLAEGFVQALPFLRTAYGASSTLNIPGAGATRANFAIVPIGVDGKISVFDVPGGNLIVDVLGYFSPVVESGKVAGGRFVAIDPVRTLDTRTSNLVPAGWVAHKPANESVIVPSAAVIPAGVSALVLNVTSTAAESAGFLRAQPTWTAPDSSTLNFTVGVDASNSVIVPVGLDGTVSVYTNVASHIVVDITGYITGDGAPVASTGLFVPVATGRTYDSRVPAPGSPVPTATIRTLQMTGLAAPRPVVPAGATAIAINLTAVDEIGPGYLTVFASGGPWPPTSSLNYVTNQAVANGVLIKLSAGGALDFYANMQSSLIVDVNGYFTG